MKRLLIIWPGYRENKKDFFELLSKIQELKITVLWIKPHLSTEIPKFENLNQIIFGNKGFRVYDYSLAKMIKLFFTLLYLIIKADVVFTSTQSPLHSKFAFIISTLLRRKFLVNVQVWYKLQQTFLKKIYYKIGIFIVKHASNVFVHGKAQLDFLITEGVKKGKILDLPFLSLDFSLLAPHTKDEFSSKYKDCFKVIYYNRITPQKGLKDLIMACYELKKMDVPIYLFVVGKTIKFDTSVKSNDDQYLIECKDLAKNFLSNNYEFINNFNDKTVASYLSISDLFVHPHTNWRNLRDGWGLTLNEAASMSLPIISSNFVASAFDLIDNDYNGFIYSAGNINELIERMLIIYKDYSRFQGKSRTKFEEYQNKDKIRFNLLKAVYD